jgi:hypothetical protein
MDAGRFPGFLMVTRLPQAGPAFGGADEFDALAPLESARFGGDGSCEFTAEPQRSRRTESARRVGAGAERLIGIGLWRGARGAAKMDVGGLACAIADCGNGRGRAREVAKGRRRLRRDAFRRVTINKKSRAILKRRLDEGDIGARSF